MSNVNLDEIDIANLLARAAVYGAHHPVGSGTPQVLSGTAVPTVSAPPGSIYMRQNGASSTVYVNQSAANPGTTWTAVTVP